jgi:hypothetical protein
MQKKVPYLSLKEDPPDAKVSEGEVWVEENVAVAVK